MSDLKKQSISTAVSAAKLSRMGKSIDILQARLKHMRHQKQTFLSSIHSQSSSLRKMSQQVHDTSARKQYQREQHAKLQRKKLQLRNRKILEQKEHIKTNIYTARLNNYQKRSDLASQTRMSSDRWHHIISREKQTTLNHRQILCRRVNRDVKQSQRKVFMSKLHRHKTARKELQRHAQQMRENMQERASKLAKLNKQQEGLSRYIAESMVKRKILNKKKKWLLTEFRKWL